MATTHYTAKAGTTVTINVLVYDKDGVLSNSSTQTATVYKPDGDAVSPAPTVTDEAGVGAYSFTFDVEQHGIYAVEFRTTGPKTADDIRVTVPKTPFSTAP